MVLPFCSPHSPVCPILLKIFLHHLLDFIPLDFLPLQGAGGPGQRPGECGRRIAGRDACPTSKGGHPSIGPPLPCPKLGAPHKRPTKGAHRARTVLRVIPRLAPQKRTRSRTRANTAVIWPQGQQGRCFRPRRYRHYRHGGARSAAFRCSGALPP